MGIKTLILRNKLKQWEIAEIMGISEFTLSRWMRKPDNLTREQQSRISAAINQLLERNFSHVKS